MRDEALLISTTTSPGPENQVQTPLELFAAVLLRRPHEPLDDEASTVVAWARSEAARWIASGRATVDHEIRLAFRFVYKMLRDRAVAADPELAEPAGSRWERVLWATCGLRHRQRAALALTHCCALPSEEAAAVLGIGASELRKVVEGASLAVARTVGEPVDVSRSLRMAGQRLAGPPRNVITMPTDDIEVARLPRGVVRNWITAPVQEGLLKDRLEAAGHRFPAPRPPRRASPVEMLLAQAEETPADMGTGAGMTDGVDEATNPEPVVHEEPVAVLPTPEPVLARTRPPHARAVLDRRDTGRRTRVALAFAAVVAVVAALIPASAGTDIRQEPPASPKVAAHRVERDAQPTRSVVVVEPGDTLWAIAERTLGRGRAWTAIWRLNRGRAMSDGVRFTDPGLIVPRWRLMLPRNA